MTLDQILYELFADKETPISLLKRYNLYNVLNNGISLIKNATDNHPVDASKFREISASILVSVNSRLVVVTDPAEKQHLELLISEIVQYLLRKVIERIDQPNVLLNYLKESLQTASSINGYDFEALRNLLKLNHYQSTLPIIKHGGIFYYDWLGKDYDLTDLADNLKAEKSLVSVKDFKRLFTNHNDHSLKVQFSRSNIPFLLALFDELKFRKLIFPKGNKGHFHPLRAYGVDFENKLLIDREPKTIKYIAQKNPEKWRQYLDKVKSWIGSYKT